MKSRIVLYREFPAAGIIRYGIIEALRVTLPYVCRINNCANNSVGSSAAAAIIADAFANEPFYRLRKFGNCVPEAAELRNVPEDSARTRLSQPTLQQASKFETPKV